MEHVYELRVAPVFSSEVKEQLKAARAKGNEAEVQRDLRKRGAISSQPTVQSGSFTILNGQIIVRRIAGKRNGPDVRAQQRQQRRRSRFNRSHQLQNQKPSPPFHGFRSGDS